MLRRTPLRRSTKPLKRTPLKPRTKPLAKQSKKQKGREAELKAIKLDFFVKHGWLDSEGYRVANCQVCASHMAMAFCDAHHIKLRSDGGKETPGNTIICHATCHRLFLHDGVMGWPTTQEGKDRLIRVQKSGCNTLNGKAVQWSPQQYLDLQKMIGRWGG
jgi:hypothetical protein